MKILIMNCSPVRNGATACVAEIAADILSPNHEVRSVCIDDYTIKLCRGCRSCHTTAQCAITDDDVHRLMEQYEWADAIISVTPSYWADVPGQFKVFIDRCTPWCDTNASHASLSEGKRGYTIALRTGPSMMECRKLIYTIEHFYGHLHIRSSGSLGLNEVENRDAAQARAEQVKKSIKEWFDC